MERYGSITTPVSIPRFIIGGMLVGGVAVVAMAFLNYGLLAGTVVAAIPAALCILWVTLRNPALAMLGLFVINYFIMGLTRYAHDLPFGMILDALIFYNILIISLQAMMHRIEWKRASSGLTVVAAIWVAYCVLEVVNPESVSVSGWFSSVRSVGVLLLLYRGAHPAHDERIQVPEIHARHLVRPDADRRGQSLASRSSSASTPPKTTGCSFSADARRTSSTAGSGISRSSATPPTSAARWDFRWSSFRSRRSITAIRG